MDIFFFDRDLTIDRDWAKVTDQIRNTYLVVSFAPFWKEMTSELSRDTSR
jgi:hypothetical protein